MGPTSSWNADKRRLFEKKLFFFQRNTDRLFSLHDFWETNKRRVQHQRRNMKTYLQNQPCYLLMIRLPYIPKLTNVECSINDETWKPTCRISHVIYWWHAYHTYRIHVDQMEMLPRPTSDFRSDNCCYNCKFEEEIFNSNGITSRSLKRQTRSPDLYSPQTPLIDPCGKPPWIEGLSDSQIIVHSSKDSAYNAWAKPESTLSYDYIIYTDGSKMDEKVGCACVFFRKEDQVPCLQQTFY